MKKILIKFLLLLLILIFAIQFDVTARRTIEGTWRAIHERYSEKMFDVKITIGSRGRLKGVIIKSYGMYQRCVKCVGMKKNKRTVGMDLFNRIKRRRAYWRGSILMIDDGYYYRVKIAQRGNFLHVRMRRFTTKRYQVWKRIR